MRFNPLRNLIINNDSYSNKRHTYNSIIHEKVKEKINNKLFIDSY